MSREHLRLAAAQVGITEKQAVDLIKLLAIPTNLMNDFGAEFRSLGTFQEPAQKELEGFSLANWHRAEACRHWTIMCAGLLKEAEFLIDDQLCLAGKIRNTELFEDLTE